MVTVPLVLCERLPLVRRPSSLAVAWIQSAVSGPERSCSYSREAPVAGSMTVLALRGKGSRNGVTVRSAAVTPPVVWLWGREQMWCWCCVVEGVGSSFLVGGLCCCCFRGCGSFLGGFGGFLGGGLDDCCFRGSGSFLLGCVGKAAAI
jgi:hypothetical protein